MKPFGRLAVTFVFATFFLPLTYAQTSFASLTLPGKADEIRGMLIDDDIFLSAAFSTASTTRNVRSYFVRPDGKKTEVDLKVVGDKPMIAGVRRGGNTFFYYVDEISKRAVIRCMVVDSIGSSKSLSETIDIPGKIYGTYIEDEDLFALCALKNEFKLKLLRIRDGSVIDEASFPLSFDIGKNKGAKVSFFDASIPTTPLEASSLVKLVKDKNLIWLIADEPISLLDNSNYDPQSTPMYKTTVVKVDLKEKKTSIKSFFEPSLNSFTSALFNGDVYRLVIDREPRIDQFNFESGKKIKTIKLLRGEEPGRDSTYARIAKYVKTEKDVKKAQIVKRLLGHLFIVDSLSDQQQLLTVGHYGDHMLTFMGFTDVLSAALSVASLLISDLSEGPYSCVYSYYVGSPDTNYTATYRTPLLRQVIDDYEYRLMKSKVRFDYRGYLNQSTFTYAFYQRNKSNVLEIFKFEK
jgi:hypothetical protein